MGSPINQLINQSIRRFQSGLSTDNGDYTANSKTVSPWWPEKVSLLYFVYISAEYWPIFTVGLDSVKKIATHLHALSSKFFTVSNFWATLQ